MSERNLTLQEKWEIDAAGYRAHPNTLRSPQCFQCRHFITGNALNCQVYTRERKPKEVMRAQTECPAFASNNPVEIPKGSAERIRLLHRGHAGGASGVHQSG